MLSCPKRWTIPIAVLVGLLLVAGCRAWKREVRLLPAVVEAVPTRLPAFVRQISDPLGPLDPLSGLLPSGTVSITLSLTTTVPADCRWCESPNTPYEQMPNAFETGQGDTAHSTVTNGWRDLPERRLYVRCAPASEGVTWDADAYERATHQRVLSRVNPPYPRTGNLWGWWGLQPQGMAYMARLDLLMGANGLSPSEMSALRALNPQILILTSINAVENDTAPDDYYLKDADGRRIEVWPGSYRLNLTKPEVADYQAQFAYQTVLDSDLQADGVFFDNVFTSQSWQTEDIYGNPVQIDADEDGQPDSAVALDAAWRAGVMRELQAFRQLMPHAIVSGHAMDIAEPGIAKLFNGISFGFATADVLEGDRTFSDAWDDYRQWLDRARSPQVTLFESSPIDQIAYGYDYAPWEHVPATTLAFARDYYPWMRFGLCLTLLGDGYFAHEFGDTWHGNDWWYDELDVDLGYPLESAQRVDPTGALVPDLIVNGGFEGTLQFPWGRWGKADDGNSVTMVADERDPGAGRCALRLDVGAASGVVWHIEGVQYGRSLVQGIDYDLTFYARSDRPRTVTLSAQRNLAPWENYGLWQVVGLDQTWRRYSVTFRANTTADDARIQFLLGEQVGSVWLDEVSLTRHAPVIYRRRFDRGLVLLNATEEVQTVDVGTGYHRFVGQQAPREEMILDDNGAGFSVKGAWQTVTYDSGEWQDSGPFYHDWGEACHRSLATGSSASWELPINASDVYTVSVWWPSAPVADAWTDHAIYEIVADGDVVASATLDQRRGGDEWHVIASAALDPASRPTLRLTASGAAPCVADAVHVWSQQRYNDGSVAGTVTLAPLDGIVLVRDTATTVYLPVVAR